MSSSRPWTAWFEARYRTKTAWFSDPDQDAIYRTLLAEYGESGPLIDDDDELRSLCRHMPIERWNRWWPKIKHRFFKLEGDGRLHNSRADEEWAKKNAEPDGPTPQVSGAMGGNIRWAKERARAAARDLAPEPREAIAEYAGLAARLDLQPMQILTPARAAALGDRLKEAGGLEGWRAALEKIEGTGFLRGEGKRNWKPDFDWIVEPKNFTRLMEGYYERKERAAAEPAKPAGGRITEAERRAAASIDFGDPTLDPFSSLADPAFRNTPKRRD